MAIVLAQETFNKMERTLPDKKCRRKLRDHRRDHEPRRRGWATSAACAALSNKGQRPRHDARSQSPADLLPQGFRSSLRVKS